jgi:hypothetical protein
MQDTNTQRDRRSFEQYVAEMEGFLTRTFGVKAGSSEIAMAREYHARGRSPEYCAWAIVRFNRMRIKP